MLRLPAAEREGFAAGFRIISPLLPAIFSWGLVTGVAMSKSVLTVPQAIGFTLMLYAGSAQLASLPLFAAGLPLWTILLTVGVINLRFVIFSAALQPHFSYLSLPRRLVLGYVNGDLGFVMFMNQNFANGYVPGKEGTYYGVALSNWAVWHVSSIIGILLGALVPDSWGLGFAGTLALIPMMVHTITTRSTLLVVTLASVIGLLAFDLPYRLNLVLGVLGALAAGVVCDELAARHAKKLALAGGGAATLPDSRGTQGVPAAVPLAASAPESLAESSGKPSASEESRS
ncbi:AzlC family ABC transporter permease [Pandoraea pulmonicola]|uniref:AzlC protein n=1 Tax=Pandoraea pulmonicola TaxID=93221 RepID=A0AAJ5D216_PANPU|nr:AzlC family ABC transporter permease [Pandoraea pulmonicola]SUA92391.1 AzlC protein [Pandoraea pulmonicola]